MHFPVTFPLGPFQLSAHFLFQSLAYLLGFRLYLRLRRKDGDTLSEPDRWTIVAAAAAGAAAGSKLLFWLSDPGLTLQHWNDPFYLLNGNTIAGALVGGLLAVEGTKRLVGIQRNTGDLFAIPLAVGIAIGRVGCFLTGVSDHTTGSPTSLAVGIDQGDGIPRHPVTLYEIAWLGILALVLLRFRTRPHREGDVFKLFMVGYFAFRLLVEFLKPGVRFGGLVAIQWVALGVLVYYVRDLPHLFGRRRPAEVPA